MTHDPHSIVLSDQPGWYRGDFHVHSNASDGDYPIATVTRIAEAEGLDFFAITDHNTIKGFEGLEEERDTLVIPGLEITFRHGHFNIFGLRGWAPWMDGIVEDIPSKLDDGLDAAVAALLKQLAEDGMITSINHPCLPPWAWKFGSVDLRYLSCLELWNDLYWPGNTRGNPAALKMWIAWLNAGHRVTAIGGSDYHYPPRPEEGKPGERLCQPATFVYAARLSVEGILDGLRSGRTIVSKGPQLDFEAAAGKKNLLPGDDLGEWSGEIRFGGVVSKGPAGTRARLLKCGEVVDEAPVEGPGTRLEVCAICSPNEPAWFSLMLVNEAQEPLLITNPIFAGPRRTPEQKLFGDFISDPGNTDPS